MQIKPVQSFSFSVSSKVSKNNLSMDCSNTTNLKNIPLSFGRDLVVNGENLPVEFREKMPVGKSIFQIIQSSQTEENKLGQGANSIVYDIPELEGYVLKVLNKDDPNKIDMSEFPSSANLGQPVWQDKNNPRLLILKKIEGNEHSIPNWSTTIWNGEIYSPMQVTKEQAINFASQIDKIANMPQATFDDLARDVQILDEKGYKLDSINPNNLIVDDKKEQIHIIDYFKVNDHERNIYRNSYMDLVAVALDFTLFPEYYDKLGENEQKKLLENAKAIQEKMYIGALNSGLSVDDDRFKTYIRTTSRWFTAHSVPNEKNNGVYFRYYDVRMEDFLNMLNQPKEWASHR